MLHSITLDGFRSFAEGTNLELAPITVLAGANSVGKSSVLATICALVQSAEQSSGPGLVLLGDWCELGRFEEVVSALRRGADREFEVGLSGDGPDGELDTIWRFGAAPGDRRELAWCKQVDVTIGDVAQRAYPDPPHAAAWRREQMADDAESWGHVGGLELLSPCSARFIEGSEARVAALSPITAANFQYLGPFRADPRDLYPARTRQLGPRLGRGGSLTAEFLYRQRHREVELLPEPGSPLLLGHAVNRWWSHVFAAELAVHVNEIERIGYTLKVDTPSAENLGLGMVGLGLSQVLPILALVLGSDRGEVIAIETPEAHLHPGAQHRLTSLFLEAARKDRQVLVETHSEHVVNAVRLAVKKGELRPEEVAIYFFEMDDRGATMPTRIELDESGRAAFWPTGFFDQASIELAELL